jgi:hypothetical protein
VTGGYTDAPSPVETEGSNPVDDLLAELREQMTIWVDVFAAYRAAEKAARDARWAEPVRQVRLEDICGSQG